MHALTLTLQGVELISAVREVGVDGGTVSGVLDPYSGIKYHVQILLRSPV